MTADDRKPQELVVAMQDKRERERRAERALLECHGVNADLRERDRLFIRAGFTEDEYSRNDADGSHEPGVSVFTMNFVGTGWVPCDRLQGDVEAAFNSCRIYYLVTGDDVLDDAGNEEHSKSGGKVLKQPLEWIAVMRYAGTGNIFVVDSLIAKEPEEFEKRKQADIAGRKVQAEAITILGAFDGSKQNDYAKTDEGQIERWRYVKRLIDMTWDRDWWAYDPNSIEVNYRRMSNALRERCAPRFRK